MSHISDITAVGIHLSYDEVLVTSIEPIQPSRRDAERMSYVLCHTAADCHKSFWMSSAPVQLDNAEYWEEFSSASFQFPIMYLSSSFYLNIY